MKIKKLTYGIAASLGVICMLVAPFLKAWELSNSGTIYDVKWRLFERFPDSIAMFFKSQGGVFQPIWATLLYVAAALAILAGIVFILMFIFSFFKVKFNTKLIGKIAAVIMLVSFLLVLTFGILFTILNVHSYRIGNVDYFISMNGTYGFSVLLAGSFFAGLFSMMYAFNRKSKQETNQL